MLGFGRRLLDGRFLASLGVVVALLLAVNEKESVYILIDPRTSPPSGLYANFLPLNSSAKSLTRTALFHLYAKAGIHTAHLHGDSERMAAPWGSLGRPSRTVKEQEDQRLGVTSAGPAGPLPTPAVHYIPAKAVTA